MKKLTLIAATLVAVSSTPAVSADEYFNPWQRCGIGAAIFTDNGVAAAISNVIWDLGTTAVTSATSSRSTCMGKEPETAVYIQENYEQIERDLVVGEGAHVAAMFELMGVRDEQAALTSLRQSLVIDANSSVAEKAESLYMKAMPFAG